MGDCKSEILEMMRTIAESELVNSYSSSKSEYSNQHALISSLFCNDYAPGNIVLRLTVIDSLYSTNAGYSYFSFEEMADRIYGLGESFESPMEKEQTARDYFYNVVLTMEDKKGIFSEPYGIQKDLSEGARQMSLMTKYAYYAILQEPDSYPLGFPIYDRLARTSYPTVCKMLGLKRHALPQSGTPSISDYIFCLNQLRTALFDDTSLFEAGGRKFQQFDILDAYLWRMGKFEDGNLSLLLSRDEYVAFITDIGLKGKSDCESGKFNTLVKERLNGTTHPFSSIGGKEEYMETLLSHWKLFERYKGISGLVSKEETILPKATSQPTEENPVIERAQYNDILIERRKNGHIDIAGPAYASTKAGLIDIAGNAGIVVGKDWNTKYLGWYIIRKLNEKNTNQ